jgi:hypothetical protein
MRRGGNANKRDTNKNDGSHNGTREYGGSKKILKGGNMSKKFIATMCVMLVAGFLVFASDSQAMPNFARKYGADCTMCHTNVPKLNRIGYEFRGAGYRLPSEIGKDEKPFNLGDFFGARIQEQYTWQDHNDKTASKDYTSSHLEFYEATLYPLTGSWGKYFGSIVELSMAPGDIFEVENAYVRGVYGDENGWFSARIGVMHPWEGFGASDRVLGNIRPLFQGTQGTGASSGKGSPFYLWNLDESALELGYYLAKTGTTIQARISNGVFWNDEAGKLIDPAQGGEFAKGKYEPGWNDPSYELFLNQIILNESGISAYWYRGVIPFPDPGLDVETTRDTFNRYAVYANAFVWPSKVNLLAGYEYGHDSLKDNNVTGHTNLGDTWGWFGEVDYHATDKLAFAARYDFFNPSDSNALAHNNNADAYTVSANYRIWNGLQMIADYQHKEQNQTSSGSNKDDKVQVRMIFIF